MTKILVCGGRRYANRQLVHEVLDITHNSLIITCIVQGGAGKRDEDGKVLWGADLLAAEWAEKNGILVKDYTVTSEMWERYGKRAGILRNCQMLDHENPQYVVAFKGGTGTAHMINYSLHHGKDVLDATGFPLRIIPGHKQASLEDYF